MARLDQAPPEGFLDELRQLAEVKSAVLVDVGQL